MIVYDIWAEWCAPCKRFAPIFEKVSKSYPDIEFRKINADENEDFLLEYGIRSIPTILIVDEKAGEIARHTGILPEAVFDRFVGAAILQSHK